jgi:hypothetical protein
MQAFDIDSFLQLDSQLDLGYLLGLPGNGVNDISNFGGQYGLNEGILGSSFGGYNEDGAQLAGDWGQQNEALDVGDMGQRLGGLGG